MARQAQVVIAAETGDVFAIENDFAALW